MRRRRLCALLLLCAAPLLAAAGRQPLPPPGIAATAPEAASGQVPGGLDDLLVLPGTWVEVRYAPETLDRAARLQERLEALVQLWKPLTRAPLAWKGAAVDRARWGRLAPGWPWGLPVRIAGPTFVVPAQGDAETVATAAWLLGGAPPDPGGDPVLGSRGEAGSLVVCDLLLQVEAARAFVGANHLAGDEPWVTGVLVQLAARYAWESAEPGRMLEVVGLFDRMAAAHGGAAAGRLADYRGGLPFDTDLWYQAQFVRGADAIWVAEGRRGTGRRLSRWIDAGKPLRRADLEKKYPALLDWQRAAFAP